MHKPIIIIAGIGLALASAPPAQAERFIFKYALTIHKDGAGKALRMPEGVACKENGDILIADSGNGRLVLFKYQNGELDAGKAIKLPKKIYPTHVEFGPKGDIFVLDRRGARRIVRLDPNGKFRYFVTFKGLARLKDAVPSSFRVDAKGDLYVLNISANQILITNGDGLFKRAIPLPAKEPVYTDLTVSKDGAIFVATGASARIYVARPGSKSFSLLTKDLSRYMSFGSHIVLDKSEKNIVVVDQHGDGLAILDINGIYRGRKLTRGWRDSYVHFPAQICFGKREALILADRNNNRVQIFNTAR